VVHSIDAGKLPVVEMDRFNTTVEPGLLEPGPRVRDTPCAKPQPGAARATSKRNTAGTEDRLSIATK